jgi:hypothetical protein
MVTLFARKSDNKSYNFFENMFECNKFVSICDIPNMFKNIFVEVPVRTKV